MPQIAEKHVAPLPELCLASSAGHTAWAHTLFSPLASVNDTEIGLHSDFPSSQSSTFF